jgi:pimeloyl-ACP methyl ester carboxylesterase
MKTLLRAAVPGATAAGLLLANRALVDRETKSAEADGGRIVELPDGDLHVLEDGPPDAPPIVLLHGFAGSLRWFDRLAPLLATEHRVIRIDLLGHGGSAKPAAGYDMESQAGLVGLVLDHLGVGRTVIVGHSMGGAVGVALAEERPQMVSGLVVINQGPDNSFGHVPLLERLGFVPVIGELLYRIVTDAMVRDGYESAFAEGFDLETGFGDPDQVVRDYRRMTYTSYKASNAAEDLFMYTHRMDERMRALGCPVLVVFGEEDSFFRAADCVRAFEEVPGVRVELMPDVGHSANVEAPQRLAPLVRELAAGAPAAAAR